MNARDWKYFLLAWGFVLLAAFTPFAFGQDPVLTVGVNDKNTYSIPSCDTKEQMLDVVNQPTPQAVRERLAHYNNIMVDNEPVCGRIEAQIVILEVVMVKTIGKFTVTVVKFQPVDYPKPVYGITTFSVRQGTSV